MPRFVLQMYVCTITASGVGTIVHRMEAYIWQLRKHKLINCGLQMDLSIKGHLDRIEGDLMSAAGAV